MLTHPLIEDKQAPRPRPTSPFAQESSPYGPYFLAVQYRCQGGGESSHSAGHVGAQFAPQPMLPRKREGALWLVHDFGGAKIPYLFPEESFRTPGPPLCPFPPHLNYVHPPPPH